MPAAVITAPAVRPAHPDLPVDRAWQAGRRLYARCPAGSSLAAQLRALGAQWDTRHGALWLTTRHRDTFTALTADYYARVDRVAAICAARLWIALPYGADLIRTRIEQLGGVWMPDLRQWALPDPAAHHEITTALAAWRDAQQQERQRAAAEMRLRDAALRAEEAIARAGEAEAARRAETARRTQQARAAATSAGRTPTGAIHVLRETYTRPRGRDAAHAAAHPLGALVRLDDGRRGIVADRRIGYVPADAARTYGHDRAHWWAEYDLAIVEPTDTELDTEQARAHDRLDADELRQLVDDAALITLPTPGDHWTPVPPDQLAGTIRVGTGTTGLVPAGQLLLTTDGRVLWQHPGAYPEHIRVEGTSRDPALADRVRAALDAGPRTRAVPGRPPSYYTVAPRA